jgi:hypothetical protein
MPNKLKDLLDLDIIWMGWWVEEESVFTAVACLPTADS